MCSKIILLLIHCFVGVLRVFIDDQLEKNDKDPDRFPLSDDFDKLSFSVSLLENMEQLFCGTLTIDEYLEMSKSA